MNTIKDAKLINHEYCQKLATWIKEHTTEFFAKENEADSWIDFDRFPTMKTDREHIIMPGEVCIVDRNWHGTHAYVVVQFFKKRVKDLYKVIDVAELKYGDWKNGYFLIPEL